MGCPERSEQFMCRNASRKIGKRTMMSPHIDRPVFYRRMLGYRLTSLSEMSYGFTVFTDGMKDYLGDIPNDTKSTRDY